MARLGRVQPQQGNTLGEERVRRRLYLSSTTSAVFDPAQALAFWDDTANQSGQPFLLTDSPAGAATSVAKAETSASGTFDVLLGQWVSKQVSNGGTIGGSASLVVARLESDAAANLVIAVGIWVIDSTGTIRGSALVAAVGSAEFNTAATATNTTMSPTVLEVQPGDRLVVELGYRATNTDTTSYTGTLFYGGTATPDLAPGDTDTSLPSYIDLEVSPAVFAGEYTTAVAENAAGTGAANNAAPSVKPNAENAAGTGAANTAAPSVTVNAENAAATGTANDAAVVISDAGPAEVATATGTANDAAVTVSDTQPAEHAAATGAASNAAPDVKVNPTLPQGVGAANTPAATIVVTIAGNAAGTGTANNAAPSISDTQPAEVATATGAANNAAPVVGAAAGNAAATGAANDAERPKAVEHAAATGAANQPAIHVKVNAGNAAGTGEALDADPTADTITNAPAGNATADGDAHEPAASVAPVAATGTATGSADNATQTIGVAAGNAAATGAANDAGVSTIQVVSAGNAAASGTANDVLPVITPAAFCADGTGAAFMAHTPIATNTGGVAATGAANNATVTTSVVASAGNASATGAAFNASGGVLGSSTSVSSEVAGGDGAAYDCSILVASHGRATGGWQSLLNILAQSAMEARNDEAMPSSSCPRCGGRLESGPHGATFCKFDGHLQGRRDWGGLVAATASGPRRGLSPTLDDMRAGWGP